MIVRRMLKHVGEQNWLAVVLDFLVVVLGIFIGLEVSNWNQARVERQQANYYIDLLATELAEDIDAGAAEIEASLATLRRSFEAAELMTKPAWSAEEEATFKSAVMSTIELWGPKHLPVSLRQLIDGGKLDLIESRPLQAAILEYETAFLEAIEQTRTSYAFSVAITPKITEAMRFERRMIVSSADELLGDRVLRAAVRDKAVWQRIQLGVLETLQASRLSLAEAIRQQRPPTGGAHDKR